MKEWFISLFQDDLGGLEITLFSFWHILYLAIIFGAIITASFLLKNKSDETKKKVVDYILIFTALSYFCDLFAMPLYLDKIDIDKLPYLFISVLLLLSLLNSQTLTKSLNSLKLQLPFLQLLHH